MENMKEIKRVELSKGLYITLYNNGICYLEIPGFEQIMVEQIKNTSAVLKGGKLKSPIILGTGKISIEITDAGTVRIPALGDVFTVAKVSAIATKLKEEETLHLEYCPHCGSHAKEQGVPHHTSGFGCNLCQKDIPFRSECGVFIEEVKPSAEPVRILWFSRHQMSIEQYQDLERIYGAIDVSVIDMTISHADEIKWDIENNDVLAVVAPPELLHEFVNYPGGRPVIVAKSERILVKSEDGESKVEFKFQGWDLMEEYTIKTRRL